jgi:hydroxypyruvate isomerase
MIEHEAQEEVNRRHLFQTLAARVGVSGVIGSPALAEAKSSTSLP